MTCNRSHPQIVTEFGQKEPIKHNFTSKIGNLDLISGHDIW